MDSKYVYDLSSMQSALVRQVLSLREGWRLISLFASPVAQHSEPDALFCHSLSCLWNKLITLMHFSRYHVDSHPLWLVRKLQHKMKRKEYTLLNMHSAQIRLRLMAESSAKGQSNIRAERASTEDDACGYLHIFRPLKARCTSDNQ